MVAHVRYAGTMTYPDNGGLTAKERAVQNDQCHHAAGDQSIKTHRLRRTLS